MHVNLRLLAALAAVLIATPLAAQKPTKEPKRPVTGDAKSALSYYRLALSKLESEAQVSADALYWALELEPSWPEALYAYRIAVLRADPDRLVRYFRRDKKVRREMAGVDSTYFRALMQDPFVYRDLDKDFVLHYYRTAIEQNVRRRYPSGDINTGDLRYEIDKYISDLMRDGDDDTRGWIAFSERRFPDALQLYGNLIGKKHDNPEAHEDRATIFFLTQRYDSAQSELEHALAELKTKDDKDRVVIYQPKAMLQFKLATVHLRQNNMAKAKESLGQALVEDLAFYPAHLTLANVALLEGDTATAGRELGLAVELKPDDPLTLMRQADLFLNIGKPDSAVAPLNRMVELRPHFATPHRLLGIAHDRKGAAQQAVAHYQKYLELTIRGDRFEAQTRARIAELGSKP